MATIPSIAMIPSGVKASKLYSVLPTDGTGDFTTTRASVATRVNENGLIEEVASNVPRLDYSDGGCPSLLLEPASTNLITTSQLFNTGWWSKDGDITITDNSEISPLGDLTSSLISYDLASRSLYKSPLGLTGHYTFSIYLKANGVNVGKTIQIDLDGIVYYVTLTNEWVRSEFQTTNLNVLQITNRGASTISTGEFSAFGAQVEANSYATSYVKTLGTTQTRVADTATGSGNSTVINSTEGVLYFESSTLQGLGDRKISLSDGTATNRIEIVFAGLGNLIYIDIKNSNGLNIGENKTISSSVSLLKKYAVRWSNSNYSFWVNGVKEIEVLSGNTFNVNSLSTVNLSNYSNTQNFQGKVKSVQVYKTALSDTELTTLTTI